VTHIEFEASSPRPGFLDSHYVGELSDMDK
jgi:hypothetical protein